MSVKEAKTGGKVDWSIGAVLRNNWPAFLTIILCVVLDQITKRAVLANLEFRERVNVIPNFFDITLVYNKGAAFSFLANQGGWQHYFFSGLAIIVSIALIYMIIARRFDLAGLVACTLITGGALGNVWDRFDHGHVVDFLLFYLGDHYYPAFNVADSFITVGATILIIDALVSGAKERKTALAAKESGDSNESKDSKDSKDDPSSSGGKA